MILARVIAREPIRGINDDFGLKALDGYYESPFCEFNSNCSNDEIADTLFALYDEEIKKLLNPNIEIDTYKLND